MTDIRCPMCGKPNDASLDVCQFCQARLKPLVGGQGGGTPAGKQPPEEEKTQPRDADAEIPDWLSSLRPGSSAEESPQGYSGWTFPQPSPASAGETGDLDDGSDWLSSLRQRSDLESEPAAAEENTWPVTGSLDDKTLPDWLQDLRPAAPQPPIEETPAHAGSDEPEWLRRVRERQRDEETPLPAGEADTADFDFLSRKIESRDAPPPSVSALSDHDIPDWLSGLGDTNDGDDASPLPGWLGDEADAGQPAPAEKDLPDWLSGVSRDVKPPAPPMDFSFQSPPPTQEQPKPASEDADLASIPSWLTNFVTSDAPAAAEGKPVVEDEYPSWLSDLEKNAALPKAETPQQAEAPAGDDFDWMGQDATGVGEASGEGETARSVSPFTLDDDDDGAFITDELPDWLKGVSAADHAEAAPAQEAGANLSPADLPVWLEAMRPVEAITTAPLQDEGEQVVEGSGPLTGLRGILRAEPDIARQKKPAAYTIKLQVSESHQQYVSMLEALINDEGKPAPLAAGAPVTSRQIVRWLVFIVMALAVIWPLFNASQATPLPLMSSEAIDARSAIGALPDGSPVLVAVEYDPGYSGELDAAAASVLDHLMIKGAHLVLVSTSPVGPAQAERLVSLVNQAGGHSYSPVGQYTNLGFIPGGAAGLQAFALSPARVLPYSLEVLPSGGSSWESGPLASIHSLADFSAVLVITENPDTARAWVEQVQPSLAGKPLVMVLSAQAEALVRPYYDGSPRQVQGMVVGVAGGAGYESSMPRTGLARRYWDAISYGAAAAILLMVGGGLVNLVVAFLPARKKNKGERAA